MIIDKDSLEAYIRHGIGSEPIALDLAKEFNVTSIESEISNKRDDKEGLIIIKVKQNILDDDTIDVVEFLSGEIKKEFISKSIFIPNGTINLQRDPYSFKPSVAFHVSWYSDKKI